MQFEPFAKSSQHETYPQFHGRLTADERETKRSACPSLLASWAAKGRGEEEPGDSVEENNKRNEEAEVKVR